MRTKWIYYQLIVLVLSTLFVFTGCGSKSSSSTTTTTNTTNTIINTPITSAANAKSSGATINQATSSINSMASIYKTLGSPTSKAAGMPALTVPSMPMNKSEAMVNLENATDQVFGANAPMMRAAEAFRSASYAPTAIPGGTVNCTDGGTIVYTGTKDLAVFPPAMTMTMTFNNCKEGGILTSGVSYTTGTFTIVGSSASLNYTTKLGSTISGTTVSGNFKAELYTNAYAKQVGILTTGITLTGTNSGTITNPKVSITGNGTLTFVDVLTNAGTTYTTTLTNFKEDITATAGAGTTTVTTTANGNFKETWTIGTTNYSVGIDFTNFKVDAIKAATYIDVKMNGTATVTTAPTSTCFNGTFTVATTTAVRYDLATLKTIAGNATINTDQVTITWKTNGSIDVTLKGTATPVNYTNIASLESACPVSTPTTSTETTAVVNAANWTAFTVPALQAQAFSAHFQLTGKWMRPDMTLANSASHVIATIKYYSTTAPTAASTPVASVQTNPNTQVQSAPIGTTPGKLYAQYYVQTSDLQPIASVDAYGYGGTGAMPSLSTLYVTQGYYVVSIYCKALGGEPSLMNQVDLYVGGKSYYTFPYYTLTAEDPTGANPANTASWQRVADFVVDASGNITVKPPDLTIVP